MKTKIARIREKEIGNDNDEEEQPQTIAVISGTDPTNVPKANPAADKKKRSKKIKLDESTPANAKVETTHISHNSSEQEGDGKLDISTSVEAAKDSVDHFADYEESSQKQEPEQEQKQQTFDVIFPNSPVYRVTDDDYNPCAEAETNEVIEFIKESSPTPVKSIESAHSDAHNLLNSIRNLGWTLTQNGMGSNSANDSASAASTNSQNLYDPSENNGHTAAVRTDNSVQCYPKTALHQQASGLLSAPAAESLYTLPHPQNFPYHAPYYHPTAIPPRPHAYAYPYQPPYPPPFYSSSPPAPPNHSSLHLSASSYQPQGNPQHSHSHIDYSAPSTQYSRYNSNNNNERGQIPHDARPFKLRVCHDFSRSGDCDGKHACPMVHLPFKVCYTFLSKGYCLGDTNDPQYDPQDRPCKFKHMTAKDLENYARRNQPHLLERQNINRNQPLPKEQKSNHSVTTTTTSNAQHPMLPSYYTDYAPNSPPYVPPSD